MAAMNGARDPGWSHALRTGWMDVVVPFPQLSIWRSRRKGRDSLTALRIVFLSMGFAAVLIVGIVWMLQRSGANDPPRDTGLFLTLVVVIGVFGLLAIGWALRRAPERDADAQGVAKWFATVTLLGMSPTLTPFLVGFVGVFVTNEWKMVLAGAPFLVFGHLLVAPGSRRLATAQQRLANEGNTVDLVGALLATPFTLGDDARAGIRSGGGTGTPPPS